MASQLESAVDRYFTKNVRNLLGGRTFKTSALVVGFPDRLVVLPGGRVFFVELKRAGGVLSPKQKHFGEEMHRLGLTIFVLEGTAGVDEWIKLVKENRV